MKICSGFLELLNFHRRTHRRERGWAIRWATNHARNHDEERRTGTSASIYETSHWITARIYNLPNITDTFRLYTTIYHSKLKTLHVSGVQGSHHQTECVQKCKHEEYIAVALHLKVNACGTTGNIMRILHFNTKGIRLDTMERFYIYNEASTDSQLNDKRIIWCNKTFETITEKGGQWHNIPTLCPYNLLIPTPSSPPLHHAFLTCSTFNLLTNVYIRPCD